MHPFYRLVREQVNDEAAAWARLVNFAHGGDVKCAFCRERICEQVERPLPPFAYQCALCDRGAPALGALRPDLDTSLGAWTFYLDQFALRLAFGPKSERRPSGSGVRRFRRTEAVRDEVDRFVTRQPEATAALFGLAELPDPVAPAIRPDAPDPRQEMGTLIRLPQADEPEV